MASSPDSTDRKVQSGWLVRIDLMASSHTGPRSHAVRSMGYLRPSGLPTQLKGRRALLVDDLPEALEVIVDRMETFGMRVDSSQSGVEAMRKVKEEREAGRSYDVMLVDWKMEPLSGVEVPSINIPQCGKARVRKGASVGTWPATSVGLRRRVDLTVSFDELACPCSTFAIRR